MQAITTIGLDIAKSVFQVHGIDAEDKVIIRRQLKRRYVLAFFQKLAPCLVGIEACASSHHWSRELKALGHTVRLMPPAYVKPYVKRQKNDAADAEAKGRTHGCTDQCCIREENPCQLGALHTWHIASFAALQHFGSYWGQSGHAERVLANLKTENLRRLSRSARAAQRVTGKKVQR